MEKKNIVIVCYKYPPIYSGYGKQLESVTKKLLEKSIEFNITILTAYEESKLSKTLSVIPLLKKKNSNSIDLFKFSSKVFQWMYTNRESIDMIHCIKAGPEAVACNLISKMCNIPLVIKIAQDELSTREINRGNQVQKIIRNFRHNFIGKADYFIAISNEIENNILKNKSNTSKIIRIPNGVDTDKFCAVSFDEKMEIRQKLQLPMKDIIILFIGAINERKGIPELLDSLNMINSDNPVRVVLCGPNLENINFKNTREVLSRENKNIYLDYRGEVDKPELYMKCADVFILPSHSEGLPNVLLEAAASGLPLVATDIGGSNEIVIDNVNGFLIQVNNKNDIAEKLNKIIINKSIRKEFGINSRSYINDYYSLDIVSEQYLQLYRLLTSQV